MLYEVITQLGLRGEQTIRKTTFSAFGKNDSSFNINTMDWFVITSYSIHYTKLYDIITFGIFLFSIGWTAFLLPSQITGGGVTGIGAVVYFITGFPMAATYFLVNVVLLGFAAKILGIKYALKSVFGMVMTSVFLGLLSAYIKEPVVKEPFMACVVGGILAGAGIGLVFNGGGSRNNFV